MKNQSIERRFFFYTVFFTLFFCTILGELYLFGPNYFPTGNMEIFYHFLINQDFLAVFLFMVILFIAFYFSRNLNFASGIPLFLSTTPFLAAAVVFVFLCLGTLLVYHNHPLAMDEYIALFQAKVYASGKLTGKWPIELLPHLVYKGTGSKFLLSSAETGLVISKYWPGFSILLTPFVFLGIPWALNPLLCALSLLVLHYLASQLFPDHQEASGWVILFTLASPQIIVNSISYYSMPAHLFFNLAFTACLMKPTAKRMFFAGLFGAVSLLLHNPFPHLLFAIPFFIWIFFNPQYRRHIWAMCLGYITLLIPIGIFYIHSRELIYEAFSKTGAVSAEGGVASKSNLLIDTVRTILKSVIKPRLGLLYVRLLCFIKLWMWAVPGLIVVAGIGFLKKWKIYPLNVLAGSFVLTFFASLFFGGSQGHGWGFRYIHQCWMILPLLATAVLFSNEKNRTTSEETAAKKILSGDFRKIMVIVCVFSLTVCNAVRLGQVYYHIDSHLQILPEIDKNRYQIVFVPNGFYSGDLIQNDPFLRDPVIYLQSYSLSENKKIIFKNFPNAERKSNYVWALNKHPVDILKNHGQ